MLACLVSHPHLEASDGVRPGLHLELLNFCHREAAHARRGPPKGPKLPQPCADIINMAAHPLVRACTIGTAALESVLLSAAVLIWNS